MMRLLKYGFVFSSFIFMSSCHENPARMPVSRKSGTFLKESVERNKELIAIEEAAIDSILNLNPDLKFEKSLKGYKYSITKPNTQETYLPKAGDIVTFNYEIADIFGKVIYTKEELKEMVYKVDKQDLMIGLRDGIKRLKVGEEAVFYFPSHLCFGYHGDNNKIDVNYPLKITVNIKSIQINKTPIN